MSVDVLAAPLALPAVALRAASDPAISAWYGDAFHSRDWAAVAADARATAGDDWLDRLRPALAPGGRAGERLERASRGIVVTTGQQPGLFGGPLYTWHKALTALALADELERKLGVPTAPVFWAATDDSDLAEATITTVSVPGGSETIVLERVAERDTPMSAVPVGDIRPSLERLREASGSAANASVLDLVRAAYTPDATLGGAYVRLLREILHPLGISVLDAAHPATRVAGDRITRAALQRAHAIAGRLQQRAEEMRTLGLRPQVRHIAGRTLVFEVNGTRRTRVRISDAVDTADRARSSELSPNVLLRPIVERCILPTAAYVGGPAEIAYFAQVSAVAEALEVPSPHIVPRWSGFLIEPHIERALSALGVTVEALRDPHEVQSRIAREELPAGVREAITDTRTRARELAPRVLESARAADLDVASAVVLGAVGQLEHKLDRLERRLLAAVKRRGSERLELLATARGALFPRQLPQERALNIIPMLARHGMEPLTAVLKAARDHVAEL